MISTLVRKEEEFFGWLVERVAEKQPRWLTDERARGWEGLILNYWPKYLTFGWWAYALTGAYDRTWDDLPWLALPSPITDWYEWRYWLRTGRWRLTFTDETRVYRIYCRLRGHPRGEIYYNPGGIEPDHRCKDCGEEIG